IRRIPLQKGNNPIRLSVSNADGRCLTERGVDIRFIPEEKPAVVQIDKPGQGVRNQRYPLRGRVLSETPIERVELRKGTTVVHTYDVSKLPKDPQGRFLLDEKQPVSLEDGTNAFTVVATNGGGPASDEVAISYLRVPVRLTFDNDF